MYPQGKVVAVKSRFPIARFNDNFYTGAVVPASRMAGPGYHAPLKSVNSFLIQTMTLLVRMVISPLSPLGGADQRTTEGTYARVRICFVSDNNARG